MARDFADKRSRHRLFLPPDWSRASAAIAHRRADRLARKNAQRHAYRTVPSPPPRRRLCPQRRNGTCRGRARPAREGAPGADLHRARYLAASRFFLAGASAKWRSTALAAAALRLALKASRLARIQSIDCERQALRSSKRGST